MSNATCRGGPATCRLQHNEAVRHVVIRAPRCAIAALTTVLLEASQPAVNSRALISVEAEGATVPGPSDIDYPYHVVHGYKGGFIPKNS